MFGTLGNRQKYRRFGDSMASPICCFIFVSKQVVSCKNCKNEYRITGLSMRNKNKRKLETVMCVIRKWRRNYYSEWMRTRKVSQSGIIHVGATKIHIGRVWTRSRVVELRILTSYIPADWGSFHELHLTTAESDDDAELKTSYFSPNMVIFEAFECLDYARTGGGDGTIVIKL